jgi:hypothetical protein
VKHWKPRNEAAIGHDESWPQTPPQRKLFGIRNGELQLMLFAGVSVGLLAAMIYLAYAYWPDGRSWGQPYKPPVKLLGSTDPRPPIGDNPKENEFEKSRSSAIPQAPGPRRSTTVPDTAPAANAHEAEERAADEAFPDQL